MGMGSRAGSCLFLADHIRVSPFPCIMPCGFACFFHHTTKQILSRVVWILLQVLVQIMPVFPALRTSLSEGFTIPKAW